MQSPEHTDVTIQRSGPEDRPLTTHAVVGERYEVREQLSSDGLSRSYLAYDQEAEEAVLLRRLSEDLVAPGKPMHAILNALRPVLGLGGRYLSAPFDADIEGDRLYVVEPLPRGVPLSAVMHRRKADDRIFGAKEVLPVVAQLAAALAAVAPPHAHLEVTARQLWVDGEGLMLTGGFLLGALPAPAVARVVERDTAIALTAAPELLEGRAGDGADLFAVGRLAHALLVPEGDAPSALTLGPVAAALKELTREDRGKRGSNLDALIEGLARLGGLPVPELDVAAFRRPRARRRPSVRAPSKEISQIDPHLLRAAKAADAVTELHPALLEDDDSLELVAVPLSRSLRRHIAGSTEGGTQEISLDQIVEEAPIQELDGLDPRLVRAALDMELEEDPPATATPKARPEPTEEITFDQIVDSVPAREDLDSIDPALLAAARAPSKTRPARGASPTQELTLDDLGAAEPTPSVKPVPRPRRESLSINRTEPRNRDGRSRKATRGGVRKHGDERQRRGWALIGSGATGDLSTDFESSPGLVAATPSLYDDSRSLPALDANALPRLPRGEEVVTDRRARRLVWVAALLSLAILASSIAFAVYRQQRTQRLRQERLEQRYQQLQEEAQDRTEP